MTVLPVLEALRFHDADPEPLARVDTAGWKKLLTITDRCQLTLALGAACRELVPEPVRERLDRNLAANAERLSRLWSSQEKIAGALERHGIEFVVLKGATHWPSFARHPTHRPQYDIDLLFPREQLFKARDVLTGLGYEPLPGRPGLPVDHLPTLIRRTGWQWRRDYYDPEMPPSVEAHFRLWDPATEGFHIDGLDEFWSRRVIRDTPSGRVPALSLPDTLAYAALHAIRHLLRGDLRLYHIYEIAHFLERTRGDAEFWGAWRRTHSASLRRTEAIAFRLATEWFRCGCGPEAQTEMDHLPARTQEWFKMFAFAPAIAVTHPNKDELWLHLELARAAHDRRQILLRRLLPGAPPPVHYAAHVPESQATRQLRIACRVFQIRFLAARALHHARSIGPLISSGSRWWWRGREISPALVRLLVAAAFFNFGEAAYFLLFNLHLLRLGFHEDTIGLVASGMSLGSIAGALPAATICRRGGIRKALLVAFTIAPLAGALRGTATSLPVLVGAAFAGGFAFAIYAVSLAPAVAALTTERSRPFGFSLVFSLGIGVTGLASVLGGQLPALFGTTASAGLRPELLATSGVALLGALVALRLKVPRPVPATRDDSTPARPASPFLWRFLVAAALWWAAIGAFNPFANAFFATRSGWAVEKIGLIFAVAQAVQVGAMLLAPPLLRRLGVAGGIACTQAATALGMLALAAAGGPLAAGVYCLYMGFQNMTEPGLYTLLMDRAGAERRATASSLNFLVMFATQAVAAAAAGILIQRNGYTTVLILASLVAMLSSVGFLILVGNGPRTSAATRESRSGSDRAESAATNSSAPRTT